MSDQIEPNRGGTTPARERRPSGAQAWLARLALLAALAAVVVLVVGSQGVVFGFLLAAVIGLACVLAGAWWFLSRTGPVRWMAAGVVIAAPIALAVLCIVRHQLVTFIVALALAAGAIAAGRAAVVRARPVTGMPERQTPAPRRPFLIMNPRSGGGKVGRFDLVSKANALGAEVALLEGPGVVDVAALARRGVADGADMLGVAGGDGTQALVAGIAAEHSLPFLVISAGTRNHFAMDLGLDRERPDMSLEALTDGVELCLDLGYINGRTFVNNASFGAYAEVVQSPAYRDDKRGTTLRMLPDLLSGHPGPQLSVRIDDLPPIEGPQAVLVSNNPYEMGDLAGLGRRTRIDTGALGVVVVTVDSAAQAADLIRGSRARGVRGFEAREVVIDAADGEIPVGIDGEAVSLATPVRCTIRQRVLRVRVPRDRPGVPPAIRIDHGDLLRLALNQPLDRGPRSRETATTDATSGREHAS
jgi:diacylglycerol kinase family enzyme